MFLYIDKPKGLTSHDVVDRVRKITNERRVGHAGTLDPNATGLLIVGVGKESTKKLDGFLKQDKTYLAEVILGEERDTDDVEGRMIRKSEQSTIPSLSEVKKIIAGFVGKQYQVPPQYSAVKIKGKEAYKLARKGKEAVLEKREVNIYSIKITHYKYPVLKLVCEVGSGTYIRSLARDLGRKLGAYAYLGNLRRTKIGKYDVKEAVPLGRLQDIIKTK